MKPGQERARGEGTEEENRPQGRKESKEGSNAAFKGEKEGSAEGGGVKKEVWRERKHLLSIASLTPGGSQGTTVTPNTEVSIAATLAWGRPIELVEIYICEYIP